MTLPEIQVEERPGGRRLRCFARRPMDGLWAMLDHHARTRPLAEGLVLGAQRVTYGEFASTVQRVAATLYHRFGVRSGARVGLLLGNSLAFVYGFYACQRLGAIAIPLGTRQAGPELAYMLEQAGASVLVGEPVHLERVAEANLPALQHRITPDELLLEAPPVPNIVINEDDVACIIYTSGTTGRPKGATLTGFNLTHTVMHYRYAMGLGEQDRTLVAVPLSHVTGLAGQLLLMVYLGGCSVLLPEFKAERFLEAMLQEQITYTIAVPTIYNLCRISPKIEGLQLPAWRVAAYGGAPMPEATLIDLAQRFPAVRLHNVYGATETASPTTINPAEAALSHPESVGRAVLCGEMRVVDEEGRELSPGSAGELLIKGPMVTPGYWENPEANRSSFAEGDFWRSGDLARIDADGQVYILDRKKDMINRGGYKIYCVEVENVLQLHPQVLDAALVGVPDPVLGERVKAIVVARNGTVDLQDLRRFCAERLADYKLPESMELTTSLPRNAGGKILKHLLREAVRP